MIVWEHVFAPTPPSVPVGTSFRGWLAWMAMGRTRGPLSGSCRPGDVDRGNRPGLLVVWSDRVLRRHRDRLQAQQGYSFDLS